MNYFISFEGLDGAGKGTQLLELEKAIRDHSNHFFGNKYSNIWTTREPTKTTDAGKRISEAIKAGIDGESASRLFVEDRIQHCKRIKENLADSYVLCDRYDLSTLGYQMTQGIDLSKLIEMHKYNMADGCLVPDVTLFFDIPAEVAYKRILARGHPLESYEKLPFLQKLEENYNTVIKTLEESGRKITRINANQNIGNVTQELLERLSNLE